MRRLLLLAVLVVVASCASNVDTASSLRSTQDVEPALVEETQVPQQTETGVEAAVDTESPVSSVVEVVLPMGREAIGAANGSPHVLWFWGAH